MVYSERRSELPPRETSAKSHAWHSRSPRCGYSPRGPCMSAHHEPLWGWSSLQILSSAHVCQRSPIRLGSARCQTCLSPPPLSSPLLSCDQTDPWEITKKPANEGKDHGHELDTPAPKGNGKGETGGSKLLWSLCFLTLLLRPTPGPVCSDCSVLCLFSWPLLVYFTAKLLIIIINLFFKPMNSLKTKYISQG